MGYRFHGTPSFKTPDPDAPKKVLPPSNLYLTFIFAKSLFSLSTINFYAPFMIILFSSLCIRAFVRSVVRLSLFRLKFLVEVVLDEVEHVLLIYASGMTP